MSAEIVARLTVNASELTAGINAGYAEIANRAKANATDLEGSYSSTFMQLAATARREFAEAFREINNLATNAVSQTSGGNGAFDATQMRAAANAARDRAAALQQFVTAAENASREISQLTTEERQYILASQIALKEAVAEANALNGKANALERLTAELGQAAVAQQRVSVSQGQMRAGAQQLGFQISDVAAQFAAGTSPMIIFAQQGSQVAQALGMMSNGSNRLLSIMGSPWTAVILAAITVVTSLGTALFATSKEADDASDAHETLAQKLDLQRHSFEEVIKASREYNAEQRRSQEITLASAAAAALKAQENIKEAISIRQKLAAELAAANQTAANSAGQGFGGATSAAVGRAAAIDAQLRENEAALRDLSITARNTVVDVAAEIAKINSDPRYKISTQFDAMRNSAKASIKDVNKLADALAKINRNEEAALAVVKEANKERSKAPKLPAVTGAEVAKLIGAPITSGKRSAAQNKAAGGAANSYHLIDQAIDIPLTINGKPLTKEGIRAALEPAGVIIKELLGPGDKGHNDHFHIAFDKKRGTPDRIASDQMKVANDAAKILERQVQVRDRLTNQIQEEIDALKSAAQLDSLRARGLDLEAEKTESILAIRSKYKELLSGEPEKAAEILGINVETVKTLREMLGIAEKLAETNIDRRAANDNAKKYVADLAQKYRDEKDLAEEIERERAQQARENINNLADYYERAFATGGKSIWQDFKAQGRSAIANLLAQWTIGLLNGNKQGLGSLFGSGGLLGGLLGGSAASSGGIIDSAGGAASQGAVSGLGGLALNGGGALGALFQSAGLGLAAGGFTGSSTGGAIGGLLGGFVGGPIGSLIGGFLGGALGGLLKKTKRGSATLSFANGGLGVGAPRGNSRSRIEAASGSVDALADMLESIAEQLGGDISGAGSVSIGIRKKKYVVDTTGQGRTKGAGVLSFTDEKEAIMAALKDALSDGVIGGISAASQRIIASGQDLQKALQKALLIEAIPKALKARVDPVGAALDELNAKWDKTIAALKEGAASAEQFADAQKLYALERADLLTAANDNLKDFINSLNFGPNSTYSLIDQARSARAQVDPYLAMIRSGNFAGVDQDKYLGAANDFLSIQRQIEGSGSAWFATVDEFRTATQSLADGLAANRSGVSGRDPFAELTATAAQNTATNTLAAADLLTMQSGQLANIEATLAQIAASGGLYGFIGADRAYLQSAA